jgi:classical protein kinase C/novel protein kinase C epsilon type
MSMEAANQILETLIRTKNLNKPIPVSSGLKHHTLRPSGPPQPTQDHTGLSYPQKSTNSSYGAIPRQPSSEAVSAATNSFMTPQSPTALPQAAQRQPLPPKSPTSTSPAAAAAASAAAAAATGMRSPQQTPSMPPPHLILSFFRC